MGLFECDFFMYYIVVGFLQRDFCVLHSVDCIFSSHYLDFFLCNFLWLSCPGLVNFMVNTTTLFDLFVSHFWAKCLLLWDCRIL